MSLVNVPLGRGSFAVPAGAPPTENTVDLNELLGNLIRKLCLPEMVVRHDVLPRVPGSSSQLEQAFGLLVTCIVANPPESCRHFLYFKYGGPQAGKRNAGTLSVFSNVASREGLFRQLQKDGSLLPALFAANGIVLEACMAAQDDCVFLLTLAGKPES